MKRILAACLITFLAAVSVAGAADGRRSIRAERASVQLALTEFRSGLRHEDGELTCSRMTKRYRQKLIDIAVDEGLRGLGCVGTINVLGRLLYDEVGSTGRKLVKTKIYDRRRQARARTNSGGRICFRKQGGDWRIDRPKC